jgi:glucokinase
VEIGSQQVRAALVDERARLLAPRRIEIPRTTVRAGAAELTRLILELAAAPERGTSEIQAIGVSVLGAVDPRTHRVSLERLEGWDRIALRQMIERQLEQAGLDIRIPSSQRRARAEKTDSAHPAIVINSDRAACVAAEAWCGAARGKQHAVFLWIGAGIRAGVLVDGRVMHGAAGLAGAAGWFALSEGFKNEYVGRGCFETEAAAQALVWRTIEEWSGSSDSLLGRLTTADASQLTPEIVVRAARGGDGLALRVVTDVCGWIGRGAADLISAFNPEVLIIGGGLGLALRPFFNEIRREARLWAQPAAAKQCRIVGSSLGQRAGLLGAARLAAQQVMGTE